MSLPGLNEEQSKTLRALQLEYNRRRHMIIEKTESNLKELNEKRPCTRKPIPRVVY
jgi:hypothetical protein